MTLIDFIINAKIAGYATGGENKEIYYLHCRGGKMKKTI